MAIWKVRRKFVPRISKDGKKRIVCKFQQTFWNTLEKTQTVYNVTWNWEAEIQYSTKLTLLVWKRLGWASRRRKPWSFLIMAVSFTRSFYLSDILRMHSLTQKYSFCGEIKSTACNQASPVRENSTTSQRFESIEDVQGIARKTLSSIPTNHFQNAFLFGIWGIINPHLLMSNGEQLTFTFLVQEHFVLGITPKY